MWPCVGGWGGGERLVSGSVPGWWGDGWMAGRLGAWVGLGETWLG